MFELLERFDFTGFLGRLLQSASLRAPLSPELSKGSLSAHLSCDVAPVEAAAAGRHIPPTQEDHCFDQGLKAGLKHQLL